MQHTTDQLIESLKQTRTTCADLARSQILMDDGLTELAASIAAATTRDVALRRLTEYRQRMAATVHTAVAQHTLCIEF